MSSSNRNLKESPISAESDRVRLDKWLWAARFFKTRALAAQAVEGGKVQLNGERTKPAKGLKIGDRLELRIGAYHWNVTVLVLSERRGPAAEAQTLYRETQASREAREEQAAMLKAHRQSGPDVQGRPTKKQRRQIVKFIREFE
jgi:ribosome-associated heat shock protein Hsp15